MTGPSHLDTAKQALAANKKVAGRKGWAFFVLGCTTRMLRERESLVVAKEVIVLSTDCESL